MRLSDCAAAFGLFILLTWLLVRGLQPDDPQAQAALRALDHYAATQSALHRDVLRARAGLLRNYDPLVGHVAAMRRDLSQVRANVEEPEAERLLANVAADADEQERLTERFKSDNALLQNSLAYFGLFSGRLTHQHAETMLTRAVEGLSGEILHLTLDTSEGTIEDLGSMIGTIEASCKREACPEDAANLIAHARLLHDLLPKVDRSLAELVGKNRGAAIDTLRARLDERQSAVEAASVRFRFLLYGSSLVLLLFLVSWERQLRARADELKRQVALEHAVAALSTGLIGGGECIVDRVQAGLERLAGALGASRAYFHCAGNGSFCAWPAERGTAETLQAAVALARHTSRTGSGVVQIYADDSRTGGIEAVLLRKLGVQGWIGVLSDERDPNFLAFDLAGRSKMKPACTEAVLRTAFDAICLAFEHEAAEKEKLLLSEQLASARRMETIGAFASGIAHNFNNLIGAISGYAEMLHARLQDDRRTCHHVDQIQLAADRGRNLVKGLLDYGRRRDYRREAIDLDALARETGLLAEAALAPDHAIAVAPALAPVPVTTDPNQVQQVLLNLCRNAAQAMEEGGTVEVETGIRILAEPFAHPHGPVPAGRYATVTVRDRGSGIDGHRLHRLFEPFYSTKPDGNGLGLSTARDILKDLDGTITIDSQRGIGTEARIWLPLREQEPAQAHQVSRIAPFGRGNGEVVLLMIRDARTRMVGEELLAALGYEPVGVDSPARLLEAIERQPDGFDAVVLCALDANDEFEALLASLRARAPALPQILATGTPSPFLTARLAKAGVDAVISAPPSPAELASTLMRCLHPEAREAKAG